jgi:hypothetical protein
MLSQEEKERLKHALVNENTLIVSRVENFFQVLQ